MNDKTKMLIVRLTPDLHKIIKMEACKVPISLQDWVTEAIKDKLIKDRK